MSLLLSCRRLTEVVPRVKRKTFRFYDRFLYFHDIRTPIGRRSNVTWPENCSKIVGASFARLFERKSSSRFDLLLGVYFNISRLFLKAYTLNTYTWNDPFLSIALGIARWILLRFVSCRLLTRESLLHRRTLNVNRKRSRETHVELMLRVEYRWFSLTNSLRRS